MKKWLNNSTQHTIAPRQTAKLQVTDIRYAKIGKDGTVAMKATRRKLLREKAKHAGVAAMLCSRHIDLMHIVSSMQVACVRDSVANKGVLKAVRMGGWIAYRPTADGLKPALGRE